MAEIIAAIAALISAIMTPLVLLKVSKVQRDVKTANGLTLAALADRAEGRRIKVDVPHGDRSTAEHQYVENLDGPQDGDDVRLVIRASRQWHRLACRA